MIAQLIEQINEHYANGTMPSAGEVGPQTWLALWRTFLWSTAPRHELPKEVKFMGISIRCNDSVPEGKLWPLEIDRS